MSILQFEQIALQDHDAEGVDEREHRTLREFRWTKKNDAEIWVRQRKETDGNCFGVVFLCQHDPPVETVCAAHLSSPDRAMDPPEKPFASLVADAETTDQLPSERAIDLEKDEGLTVLTDEGSSEADSDDEDVHAAHAMWADDPDRGAEVDPLSTIPGTTSSTVIRATAQSCQRGLVAKKVDSSNNYEIFFDLHLQKKQKDRRGIAHFSVGGVHGSQLPRICVAPNSSQLWIFVRHGKFRAKLATNPIPLNKTVKVRFRLLQNTITVDIDNKIEGRMEGEHLLVPVPAKLFCYLSGPGDKAGEAVISNAMYRWRHFKLRPRVQAGRQLQQEVR